MPKTSTERDSSAHEFKKELRIDRCVAHLITSRQNVRERPTHNIDIVDAAIPSNMTGFRPMRSESRLKGRIDMVAATLRNVACGDADEQTN